MDILARADELVALLEAAGLSATSDPAKVDAAFKQTKGSAVVLVAPLPQLDNASLCNEWSATWQLVALAPRGGGRMPAERLVRALEQVVDVLPISRAVPGSYALEEGQTPYPAYVMTMED